MVGIDPSALPRGQRIHVDQLPAHGYHGDVLEAEVGLVAEVVRRGDFARHYDVCGGGLGE